MAPTRGLKDRRRGHRPSRTVLIISAAWLAALVAAAALWADSATRSAGLDGSSGADGPVTQGGLLKMSGPRGRLLFDGSFHPGSLRPWNRLASDGLRIAVSGYQGLPPDIAIVHPPGKPGIWAARFTVRPGMPEVPNDQGHAERNEILASQQQSGIFAGRSAWYAWETYFPSGFRTAPDHSAFIAQVKRVGGLCGSPNIAFVANADPPRSRELHTIRLLTSGGTIPGNDATDASTSACPGAVRENVVVASFRYDHWYRFLVHVRWSSDRRDGYVQVWVDGREATPLIRTPTLYTGSGGFWKEGLYERVSPWQAYVYQTGLMAGTTMRAVLESQANGGFP